MWMDCALSETVLLREAQSCELDGGSGRRLHVARDQLWKNKSIWSKISHVNVPGPLNKRREHVAVENPHRLIMRKQHHALAAAPPTSNPSNLNALTPRLFAIHRRYSTPTTEIYCGCL